MKVTLMLADFAQAVGGKLYILGGGWSVAGPGPVTMAIAIKIEVPWDQANRQHTLRLSLLDEDGRPVMIPTPTGDRPMEFTGNIEVGRPPGLRPGTPLDVSMAFNMGLIPVPPDGRYVWQCYINDHTQDDWRVAFSTRPVPQSPQGQRPPGG